MAYIDPTTPKFHGYKSYATFNDTSSEKEVLNSGQSMPMTLYFAICHFSYPKVIHSILPRQPPDGFISSPLILVLITLIFATMTNQTCLFMSFQKLRQYGGNGSDSGSGNGGSGGSGGDGGPTLNGGCGILTPLIRVPIKKQLIRVMLVVPLLNSSIPILVLRCLDLDF